MSIATPTSQLPAPPPLRVGAGARADEIARGHKVDEELGAGRELAELSICRYCWGQHPGACPYIKVIEWHPNGQIARVVLEPREEAKRAILYPEPEPELVEAVRLLREATKGVRIATRPTDPAAQALVVAWDLVSTLIDGEA